MSTADIKSSLADKIGKVARYIRLYGFGRTLTKIKGQYHLSRNRGFSDAQWNNPKCKSVNDSARCVAIIGSGYYSYSVIAFYLKKLNPHFLRCTLDLQHARARSLCEDYGGAYATVEFQRILDDPLIKIVFIASNHATHAEYAASCIRAGKHVHIEKPHVVSYEQLELLRQAQKAVPSSRVFLGFNRPRSFLYSRLREFLIDQTGPLMINWFIVGHHLQDNHWYYDPREGGRILGNLSHWSDLTLQAVGVDKAFPCDIVPATLPGAKSDYVVAVNFADGSAAVISFSAKGATSSGVYEVMNLQKGNCIASLNNFETLSIDLGNGKKVLKPFFRDHGHGRNIFNSYLNALSQNGIGESFEYIQSTALLFLSIREAMESGKRLTLDME